MLGTKRKSSKNRGGIIITRIFIKEHDVNDLALSLNTEFPKGKRFNLYQKQQARKLKNYVDSKKQGMNCDYDINIVLNNQLMKSDNRSLLEEVEENSSQNRIHMEQQDITEKYELNNSLSKEDNEKGANKELETFGIRVIPNENNYFNANINEINDNFYDLFQKEWDDLDYDDDMHSDNIDF